MENTFTERLNAETVAELKKGDTVIFIGHEDGEDGEDLTIGKLYEITSDFGEEGGFMAILVGQYAGFTDDAGDECVLDRVNCGAFALHEGGTK